MPERLLEAVDELVNVVRSLEKTLKEDYPRRDEMTRNRRSMIYFVVIAIVASYFTTVGTISLCFLGRGARAGQAPALCKILPGYSDAQTHSNGVMSEFNKLVKQSKENAIKIKHLEQRLR